METPIHDRPMNLTDDEMRVKCAEAMGWTYHGHSPELRLGAIACWTPAGREFDPMRLVLLPDYLHDLNAALTLCDRLREEGWTVQFYRHPLDQWRVELRRYAEDEWPYIEDPSLARAICLAFLKVKENQ